MAHRAVVASVDYKKVNGKKEIYIARRDKKNQLQHSGVSFTLGIAGCWGNLF